LRKECRNDDFFGDLAALVPSHLIGCIVEKKGGPCCIASNADETK